MAPEPPRGRTVALGCLWWGHRRGWWNQDPSSTIRKTLPGRAWPWLCTYGTGTSGVVLSEGLTMAVLVFYPHTLQALSTCASDYPHSLQYFWCLYQVDSITKTTRQEYSLQGWPMLSAHGGCGRGQESLKNADYSWQTPVIDF